MVSAVCNAASGRAGASILRNRGRKDGLSLLLGGGAGGAGAGGGGGGGAGRTGGAAPGHPRRGSPPQDQSPTSMSSPSASSGCSSGMLSGACMGSELAAGRGTSCPSSTRRRRRRRRRRFDLLFRFRLQCSLDELNIGLLLTDHGAGSGNGSSNQGS